MSMDKEILRLTERWVADCRGQNILVPMGAAMNVLKTISNQAPQDVKDALADFLQMMAKDLTGERH
jgi:hydrogenase maturation factor